VLARAKQVTACSNALLHQALTVAPEIAHKARVIHNGVDLDIFGNAEPYNHSRTYLLAVGQLEQHKGFHVLLEAWAEVQHLFLDVDLLVAGDGHEWAGLLAHIQGKALSGRVHLLGAVSSTQVAALMHGSLAVVIPSCHEGFGIVAVEAMATGKPIIATRVDGLVEALAGAEVTWTPVSDPSCLGDVIKRTLESCAGGEAIFETNRVAARGHSWSKVSKRYLELFAVK